jgi:hypothetical protein
MRTEGRQATWACGGAWWTGSADRPG